MRKYLDKGANKTFPITGLVCQNKTSRRRNETKISENLIVVWHYSHQMQWFQQRFHNYEDLVQGNAMLPRY